MKRVSHAARMHRAAQAEVACLTGNTRNSRRHFKTLGNASSGGQSPSSFVRNDLGNI